MTKNIISLFPLWAILSSIFAYFQPSAVVGLKGYIIPLLIAIMFSMGVTLKLEDFKRAIKKPKIIAITVALQFLIMPLSAFVLSKLLGLSVELTVGMVLVGAVSGGTASNVMAYIAKADVALSITMTIVSTLISVLLTPYLTLLYVEQSVPVPALNMLISIAKMVLLPVFAGVVINYFLHEKIEKIKDVFAIISMVAIVSIIAIVVGLNQSKIATIGLVVVVGIILHNLIGLASGYYTAKVLGYDKKTCKTVAIEVGMQNSGLAVALAVKYFSATSALPGAIFSIWHNISGSILAGYWSKKD